MTQTWQRLLDVGLVFSGLVALVTIKSSFEILGDMGTLSEQFDAAHVELDSITRELKLCTNSEMSHLKKKLYDMQMQLKQMNAARNETLRQSREAVVSCKRDHEAMKAIFDGVSNELKQLRREMQQSSLKLKRDALKKGYIKALAEITGDEDEVFKIMENDELRNTMIMKLSSVLDIEIADLQELSDHELLKRAKVYLAKDETTKCEEDAPEVMQQALIEFREEAQQDVGDIILAMCYIEVRNALIDEVHSRDGSEIAGLQALSDDELVESALQLLREGALPHG